MNRIVKAIAAVGAQIGVEAAGAGTLKNKIEDMLGVKMTRVSRGFFVYNGRLINATKLVNGSKGLIRWQCKTPDCGNDDNCSYIIVFTHGVDDENPPMVCLDNTHKRIYVS